MITLKRAYEPAAKSDGYRILVDRLWPRGVSKERAHLDLWLKDIAPSTQLRTWFNHDLAKWHEFVQRYKRELEQHKEYLHLLVQLMRKNKVTFIYAARDTEHNEAVVLKDVIEKY